MADKKKDFKSLIDFGTPFDSKNGKEVRATLSGFAGKDSEVRKAGSSYVVSNFTNLSGVVDQINEIFGTDFVEHPEFNNIPAGISWFTHTEEEANAIADRLKKGARLRTSVTIGTREGDGDKIYLDLRVDQPYIEDPKPRNAGEAPMRKGDLANGNPLDVSDDDLPF